jgi:hypothetical protein
MSEDFDWSPLGEAFWSEAQKTCGATDMQVRFSVCRHRGMTAVGAARASGYSGDADSIRQAGHRAAKSTAVMNMLALAQAEAAGGDDGTVTPAEARRILSRLARGSDPSVRIKALENLGKMDREQREREGPPKRVEPGDDIRFLLGIGTSGLHMVACMFCDVITKDGPRINLTGALPLFDRIAPNIAQEWPELWVRIIDRLDVDGRAEAVKYAAGAPIDLMQFNWSQPPPADRPARHLVASEGEASDAVA